MFYMPPKPIPHIMQHTVRSTLHAAFASVDGDEPAVCHLLNNNLGSGYHQHRAWQVACTLPPRTCLPLIGLGHASHQAWLRHMAHITEEQRWAIISSWKRTECIAATAREVGLPYKTAHRWVKAYRTTGGVCKRASTGRKPTISMETAQHALDLLLDERVGGAQRVACKLHADGLTPRKLHRTTVIRAVSKAAKAKGITIRAVRSKPTKLLSAATKAKRLAFCERLKGKDLSAYLFTDRKKFYLAYPGTSVGRVAWVQKGQTRQAAAVNHPMCINIYAGISKYGVTDIHVVAGSSKHRSTFLNKQGKQAKNITASEYEHVLDTTLLPEGSRIFTTAGHGTWTLQQDNDPAHKHAGSVLQRWNDKHGSSVRLVPDWPPSSPDLNPIENVWAYVQAKVNAAGCKTFEEFSHTVKSEFKAVPATMLRRLHNSMQDRISKVIERLGDKSGY